VIAVRAPERVADQIPQVLQNASVAFAGNAVPGLGGQGEFLRQMAVALTGMPRARTFGRPTRGVAEAGHVSLPFERSWPRFGFDMIRAMPRLRARQDWLTLAADIDFDHRLMAAAGELDLLDAVAGQCCRTFEAQKRRGARLVFTSLNTHIDHLIDTLAAERRRSGFTGSTFIHPRMRRRILREMSLADRVRVNSNWAKKTFIERGVAAGTIDVIHPAVDRSHFHPADKRDDVFRVLAVSTIEPRKGIYYLLQAFEQARIPRSELVIIGGTGDRWSKQMLQDFLARNSNMRVIACDVMTTSVADTYGSASVVVHPALEDGYGLVVVQALASGRPVIASRQAGAAELIHDGEHGFVIDAASVMPLVERLRLLAADRAMLDRMSAAAPAAIADLTSDNFAREVHAMYARVLSAPTHV
jgi:glycosyltransferase involved in cell wall biosynthesis